MKIAYLLKLEIPLNCGVTKKVVSQVNTWRKLGHQVEVFCSLKNPGKSILNARQYRYSSLVHHHLFLNKNLLKDIEKFSPDIIYFRMEAWSKNLEYLLGKYPSVVELNSDDLSETSLLLLKHKNFRYLTGYIAYRFLRNRLLYKVKGMIAVSYEIAALECNKKYKLPIEVVPNSIDLSSYPVLKKNVTDNKKPGIFFIGTEGRDWHGIDYVMELSRLLPKYNFHISTFCFI
jgi:glycosyltransferase involved in cell wall biosynthesis